MIKPLFAVMIAAAMNCPLVNVAGTYTVNFQTQSASSWEIDSKPGCRKSGTVTVEINSEGLMNGDSLEWPPGNMSIINNSGKFSGRVAPGKEPMSWEGSAMDVEMKGTWNRGQLSGEFVRRFIYENKEIECKGKISGFKTGK